MKYRVLVGFFMLINGRVWADNDLSVEVVNNESSEVDASASYIGRGNYIQNPYIGMASGGGTQELTESAIATHNAAEKLFADGSWNVFGAYSYIDQNGAANNGYAVNLFGQTGQLGGFSVGGLLTIANPFFANQISPTDLASQAQGLSVAQQVTPQELFVEYQHDNIIQADAGWIGISNSPWMTYYQNNALNMVTHQGLLLNIHPGSGWLLTAFALNGTQLLGETGFSGITMYNQEFDYGTGTANIGNQSTPGTLAAGASWNDSQNLIDVRLWGYEFLDYSSLAYADTTLKLAINDELGFTLGLQGALQGSASSGNNILNNSGYGSNVNSNMLGASLGFNYKIFSLQLGYNNIWGPSDGYEGGGLISPYTYQLATDPLYTTGWMQGMVEKSAGQAYKIAPALSLLDNNLVIAPSYQYYATSFVPASREYDFTVSYALADVKGLTIFAGYGYVQQGYASDGSGGDTYQGQVMFSYLY